MSVLALLALICGSIDMRDCRNNLHTRLCVTLRDSARLSWDSGWICHPTTRPASDGPAVGGNLRPSASSRGVIAYLFNLTCMRAELMRLCATLRDSARLSWESGWICHPTTRPTSDGPAVGGTLRPSASSRGVIAYLFILTCMRAELMRLCATLRDSVRLCATLVGLWLDLPSHDPPYLRQITWLTG